MAGKTLCFSSFNSERLWKYEDFASFTFLPDKQGDRIVNVMDEMQYAFCLYDDATLLTNVAMNPVHKEYLQSLDLSFGNDCLNTSACVEEIKPNVAESIWHSVSILSKLSKTKFEKLVTYSILPYMEKIAGNILPEFQLPALETVKKVNSKFFSTELSRIIGDLSGEIVWGIDDLSRQGTNMLEKSPFLVKEPFGVSGAGNVLIDKPTALRSIVRFLQKQELSGKKVAFVLEPFYKKERDFSSLFYLRPKGEIDFIGMEIMENNGFSFSKIYPANEEFINFLRTKGYFERTSRVLEALSQESYWGPVCIDSMLLADGSVKFIVEINARHSMGFINEFIGNKLNETAIANSHYQLGMLNRINRQTCPFESLFNILDRLGVLYTRKKGTGIFPVSANTWDVNDALKCSSYKRRFYYMIFFREQDELTYLSVKLEAALNSLVN